MTRPLRAALCGLLLLSPAGCAPYLVVRDGGVDPAKLSDIKSGLSAMRGLDFKADVPIEVKSQEEIKRFFAAELDREYGGEKLQNLALAYGKLGLFPEGFDLRAAVVDFYGSQVAGFYDPRLKKLFLPSDFSRGVTAGLIEFFARRDIMGEVVLAHELTHALQDQHFSLAERLGPSDNDDRTLAFRAVAEGDATLSGFGYLLGDLDRDTLPQVKKAVEESIEEARAMLGEIPPAILEELLFQYYGGVSFVSRVLEERGWLGVTYLYRHPPVSTEQILHPERFFDAPDPPLRIVLPDLRSLFPAGWHEIENNVLGEVMVRALFKQFIGEEAAKAGADGWGGDRLVAFRREDEVALVWATAWDSVADAAEFFHAYREVLERKRGGGASASAHIEQRDRRVVIVEGLENKVEEIWRDMRVEAEPFDAFFARLRSRPAAAP